MNPFANSEEPQFLVGKELNNLSFYSGHVFFGWWEGGGIRAYRPCEHIDKEGRRSLVGVGSQEPSALHRLIQRKVSDVEVGSDWFKLVFDDGQSLRLFWVEGAGECGIIQFGDDLRDDYIIF